MPVTNPDASMALALTTVLGGLDRVGERTDSEDKLVELDSAVGLLLRLETDLLTTADETSE